MFFLPEYLFILQELSQEIKVGRNCWTLVFHISENHRTNIVTSGNRKTKIIVTSDNLRIMVIVTSDNQRIMIIVTSEIVCR